MAISEIEKNMDGIELQVNARNGAAYEMYKRYGFTEKSINMELLARQIFQFDEKIENINWSKQVRKEMKNDLYRNDNKGCENSI